MDAEKIAEMLYRMYVESNNRTEFMDLIKPMKPLEGFDEKVFWSLFNKLWHGGYHEGRRKNNASRAVEVVLAHKEEI